ncbi:MAG: hypothetical protein JWR35_3752 [Marmoricola sp.]|nr:hypothetical protein [Marmoricola sp.]
MDPNSARPGRRPARGEGSARLEILVTVPIGVAVAVAAALLHSPAVGLLLGWDTVAVLYLGWLAFVLVGRDGEQTARRATTTDPDRVATDIAPLSAAVASLVTVAFLLIRAPHSGSALEFVQVGFGVVSVVVSWALVHTLFTSRYAALFYGRPGGGIDFNSDEPPTYRDLAYLAFTVGMTFQVSDTVLHSTAPRRTVLRQARSRTCSSPTS